MRPLSLAALLFLAAPGARAQSKTGAVDAGAFGGPTGSLTSSLTGSGVPALIPPGLAAPALSASLTPVLTPAALAPSPLLLAAPYAAAAAAENPALAAAPAAFFAPAPRAELKPGPTAAVRPAPAEPGRTPIGELISYTKRLFGEATGDGAESAEYFRPGAPFEFGRSESALYRSALDAPRAKSGAEEVAALVGAAEALAKSAGIAIERGERPGRDGVPRPVLRVTPAAEGHRLNRLAWDLAKTFDSVVEYAPHRTNGGVAAYNAAEKVLFLPDFGREDAFEAILHESRHAMFAKRLRAANLSAYHAALIAYEGRSIAPNAQTYESYMSLEEISTHAKTILHALQRARRGGGAGAASDARRYAYQLADVLRSADINLFQLQRRLAKGELKSYPVAGESWPAIPGGRWEAINLPHAILVLPVLDEGPAPRRKLLDRLFKGPPETAAARAARRHAEALRPLIAALDSELGTLLRALEGASPDLAAARDSAARMTGLAGRADKAFAASAAR